MELTCVISQSKIELLEKERDKQRIINSVGHLFPLEGKEKYLFLMRNLFSCLTCFPLVYTDKRDGSLSILKIAVEEIPFVNEVSLPNN